MAARHTVTELSLKASGPMKCAGPLNGYLIALLYGSGRDSLFFPAMQGAGGGGFNTCEASDPTQTAVAETSKRHKGGAD